MDFVDEWTVEQKNIVYFLTNRENIFEGKFPLTPLIAISLNLVLLEN